MKKFAILASILALAACGGGSGGGHGGSTYQPEILKPENVITEDMLTRNAELAKKLQTIEYVENNLGDLGSTPSTQSVQTGRGASGRFLNMTLSDFEKRYQQALAYFDVLEKVMNKSGEITIGDLKIAYSLAANKPLNEITKYDLPGIDIEHKDDTTVINVNTLLSNLQIYIKDRVETNIDLKDSATQDIKNDITELASTEEIDHNASLINPELLKNLDNIESLKNMFAGFEFIIDENNGKIIAADVGDEYGSIPLERVNNSSVFKSNGEIYFLDIYYDSHNRSLATNELKTGTELRAFLDEKLAHDGWYTAMSDDEKTAFVQKIDNGEYAEWSHANLIGDLHSLGKVNGLKYSDFGYYKIKEFDFTFTYEGGIDDHKIDKDNMPTDNTFVFKGTAAGELQSNFYPTEGEEISDNKLIVTNNGAATLTFNNGTETMNLPFNNWYTVNVEREPDGFIKQINFTDDNNLFANGANADWKLEKESVIYDGGTIEKYESEGCLHSDHGYMREKNGELETHRYMENENDMNIHTMMTTTYYHNDDNNAPVEATGYLNHVEEHVKVYDDHDQQIGEKQIWFSTTFGGTKQP